MWWGKIEVSCRVKISFTKFRKEDSRLKKKEISSFLFKVHGSFITLQHMVA